MINGGAVNGFIVNGSSLDPVVRVRVDALLRAVGSVTPRVLAYAKVDSAPTAEITGKLGWLRARNPVGVTAEVDISGSLGFLLRRAPVVSTPTADIEVPVGVIRSIVRSTAEADITAVGHVYVRLPTQSVARVDIVTVDRALVRSVIDALGQASIVAEGVVFPRREIRSLVASNPSVDVDATGHIDARLLADVLAQSLINVDPHVLIRDPVMAEGEAQIDVADPDVARRAPWDEAAPDDRAFRVAPETFTFLVVT